MKHPVVHIGVGNVGKETASQITQFGENLTYSALFDRTGGAFAETGLSSDAVSRFPEGASADITPDSVIDELTGPCIFVDTTAADTTLASMKKVLSKGGAVVMSNKKPITGTQADWDELHRLGDDRLFYETTVGAGLPVIQTLKSLLATGDKIIEIQGCFSGTLGFLFSELEAGTSFSTAVTSAKEQGFTEPDPRDDLSGMDVARKVLILSRVMGKELEITDVSVEPLYNDALAKLSKEEFMEQVTTLDQEYAARAEQAAS
ncbi:homoserine dehydrogenase, partial [Candidatus Saccharibacteria bacterium]|nr:homoserine dehydrogenase [Candidatus Saccharibacteria bacterium]